MRRTLLFTFFVLLLIPFASGYIISDQAVGVRNNGDLVQLGNLNILLYRTASGGTPVYNGTFANKINNGSWSVYFDVTGITQGETLYKDYRINSQNIDFRNMAGAVIDRLPFTITVGETAQFTNYYNKTIINLNLSQKAKAGTCPAGMVMQNSTATGVQCITVALNTTNFYTKSETNSNFYNKSVISNWNATKAHIGNCPTGTVMQNTTSSGVQCIAVTFDMSGYYNKTETDGRYLQTESDPIWTAQRSQYFNKSKNEIITGDVTFTPNSNVSFNSGKVLFDTAVYFRDNVTITTPYKGKANTSIMVLDISGQQQANLNVSGLTGYLNLLFNGVSQVKLSANGDSYLNGGDLGIGTSNPSEKVDVIGNVKANNFLGNWNGSVNYYTKDQINGNFSSFKSWYYGNATSTFYTKSQSDARYLQSESDPIWTGDKSNYWNKTASDARYLQAGNYYTKSEINSNFTHYYNKTQSDARYLQSYTETDPVWVSERANYYLKTTIDSNFYTKTQINGNLSTKGHTGTCPTGYAMQNSTATGVQCVAITIDTSNFYNKTASDNRYYLASNPNGYISSTYNATYAMWAYNQTVQAIAYVNSNFYNKTASDGRYLQNFTETDPIWSSQKLNYYNITEIESKYYNKTESDARYTSGITNETDPIASPRIDTLNTTKLNITDQRYNDTAKINTVNTTSNIMHLGFYNSTYLDQYLMMGGIKVYWLTNANSLDGRKNLSIDFPTNNSLTEISVPIGTSRVSLGEFISPAHTGNLVDVAGVRNLRIVARVTDASRIVALQGTIYLCKYNDLTDSCDSLTFFKNTTESSILSTMNAQYTMSYYNELIILNSSTRFVLNVTALKTSGSGTNVVMSIDDDTYSRFEVPSPVGVTDISNKLDITDQRYNESSEIAWLNSSKGQAGTCPAGYVMQNSTSTGVQCVAVTFDTSDFYNKSTIDSNFSKYYNKTQSDAKYLQNETDPIWSSEKSNYYNRSTIDMNFTNYYTRIQTDFNFSNYYTINYTLTNYYTSAEIDNLFYPKDTIDANFYYKEEVDNLLALKLNVSDQRYNESSEIAWLNSSKGQAGNCPAGYVMQNSTSTGVECIAVTFDANNYYNKTDSDNRYYLTSNPNGYISSTYNSTYAMWAYNQTAPANSYTDSKLQNYYNKSQINNNFSNYYLASNPNGYISSTYNATYDMWAYNQTTEAVNKILSYNYINSSTNIPKYAGFVTSHVPVNNGDGTLTIQSETANLYATTDGSGALRQYTLIGGTTGSTLPAIPEGLSYIVGYYNGGSPIFTIVTTLSNVHQSDYIIYMTVFRDGNDVEYMYYDGNANSMAERIDERLVRTDRFKRESGLNLLEKSGRVLNISSGVTWIGSVRKITDSVQTNITETKLFHRNNTGDWVYDTVTQYDNSHYDTATGLTNGTVGNYTINWIYESQELNPEIYILLGTDEYSSVASAVLATIPTSVPLEIQAMGLLVGRVVVGVGNNTAEDIGSAFSETIGLGGVSKHNDLSDIQGGQAGEYYHLTAQQVQDNIDRSKVIKTDAFYNLVGINDISAGKATFQVKTNWVNKSGTISTVSYNSTTDETLVAITDGNTFGFDSSAVIKTSNNYFVINIINTTYFTVDGSQSFTNQTWQVKQAPYIDVGGEADTERGYSISDENGNWEWVMYVPYNSNNTLLCFSHRNYDPDSDILCIDSSGNLTSDGYINGKILPANILNPYWLNITDQRYNESAEIAWLNSSKGQAGTCPAGYVMQNSTSTGVQCVAVTFDTSDFYNKSTIDSNFSKYYNKTQSDAKYLQNETDPVWSWEKSDYYTKSQINNNLSNYYLASNPNGYISSTYNATYAMWAYNQTIGAIVYVNGNFYNKSAINGNFSNYYTKSQINGNLSNYYLASNPNGYISSTYNATYAMWAYNQTTPANAYTDNKLQNYYNKSQINANLSNYYLASNPNGYISSTYNATYDMWAYNQTTPAVNKILSYNYWNASSDIPRYSGFITSHIPINNGDGTLTIQNEQINLYSNVNGTGLLKRYTLIGGTTGSTLPAIPEGLSYLVGYYNGGSPIFTIVTNRELIQFTNYVPYLTLYRRGIEIEVLYYNGNGNAVAEKINDRLVRTDRFKRESGFTLGEGTNRSISITSGVVWLGTLRKTFGNLSSATTESYIWHKNSTGDWTRDAITQYDNENYNNGTGQSPVGTGNYTVNWVYLSQEIDTEIYVILAEEPYDSLASALASGQPASKPDELATFGLFLGRIIVQSGNSTAQSIQSAFTDTLSLGGVTNHNDLSGIQGGQSAEYYHLTGAEKQTFSDLNAVVKVDANNKIVGINSLGEGVATLQVGTFWQTREGTLLSVDYNETLDQTTVDIIGGNSYGYDASAMLRVSSVKYFVLGKENLTRIYVRGNVTFNYAPYEVKSAPYIDTFGDSDTERGYSISDENNQWKWAMYIPDTANNTKLCFSTASAIGANADVMCLDEDGTVTFTGIISGLIDSSNIQNAYWLNLTDQRYNETNLVTQVRNMIYNNASAWTSTYNSTYATWAYNQTTPAIDYTKLNYYNKTVSDGRYLGSSDWNIMKDDFLNRSKNEIITGNYVFTPTSNISFSSGKILFDTPVYFRDNVTMTVPRASKANTSIWITDISGQEQANLNVSGFIGYLNLKFNGANTVQISGQGDSYLNGGDVGIGTDNPTEKLDVVGNVKADNFLGAWNGSSNYYTKTQINNNFTNYYTRSESDSRYYNKTSSDSRYLNSNGDNATGDYTFDGALKIDSVNQRIGIRTNNPQVGIHLNGTSASYARIQGGSDGDNYAGLELWNSAGTTKWQFALKSVAGSTNNFDFAHYNGVSWSSPFTISASDNVGIGTTTPDQKLEVNGTIRSDALTANRALISNGTKDIVASSVTSTELGYVSGVTSSIQTQLNHLAPTYSSATYSSTSAVTYTTIFTIPLTASVMNTVHIVLPQFTSSSGVAPQNRVTTDNNGVEGTCTFRTMTSTTAEEIDNTVITTTSADTGATAFVAVSPDVVMNTIDCVVKGSGTSNLIVSFQSETGTSVTTAPGAYYTNYVQH